MRGQGLAKTGGWNRVAPSDSRSFGVSGPEPGAADRVRRSVAPRSRLRTSGQNCGISTVGGAPGGVPSRNRRRPQVRPELNFEPAPAVRERTAR